MQTVEGGGTVRIGKFCKRLVIKNSKGCALPIIQEKHFYSDFFQSIIQEGLGKPYQLFSFLN